MEFFTGEPSTFSQKRKRKKASLQLYWRTETEAENQSSASQAKKQIATEGSRRLVEDNNNRCYMPSHELALILSFLLAFDELYLIFPNTHEKKS